MELIEELKKENELLKKELEEIKERLSKYTFNDSHKKYRQNNKEKILEAQREYSKKYKEKKKLEKCVSN
jgi:hypothetical protein